MTIKEGEFIPDTGEAILDAMMADAKEYFGSDLNDDQLSIIRTFYTPVADRLAEAQEDIGLVLASAQIDNAEGTPLDLLTALIGVSRQESRKATGEVTFSRSSPAGVDYTIPSGTTVQTDSTDPIEFKTTESVTLFTGETSVTAEIEAVEGGVEGNVGPNTITVMPDPPAGAEEVTNPAETSGGTERETDEELRERAKSELAEGTSATAAALITGAKALDGVKSVSIFINDSNQDNTGSGGLPDHSFELVVEGGNDNEIGQMIADTKAAGDTSYAGAYGNPVSVTASLPNGQDYEIEFSRPIEVQIFVDVDMMVTDEYAGDEAVRDSIVEYLGGLFTTGNESDGDLSVGDDVIYGEIEYAIRDVAGVYDINSLTIGTSASPSGTANIAIQDNEVATADATDGSITIATTTV